MTIAKRSIVNLPISALVALIVTSLLFIAIPLLTKFSRNKSKRENVHHVLISQRKPPPPPELEKEEKIEQKKREEVKKTPKKKRMARPKLNLAMTNLNSGLGGTIAISGLLNSDFEVSDSLFVSAFNLSEVDQQPRLLRAIAPRYPFAAAQKGIEGRVMLRFVVDSTGKAREAAIVESEPEGIFDESALSVVKKYKFKPAMKDGKAVDCIVKVPIKFTLNE